MSASGQTSVPRRATFRAFDEAWTLLWANAAQWALCAFVLLLVNYAITLPVSLPSNFYMQAYFQDHGPLDFWGLVNSPVYMATLVLQVLAASFVMPFTTGFARAGLRAFRGQTPDVGMVFQLEGRYWSLVLYWLLHQFLAMALMVMLVIPGIVFYVVMYPASLLVVERRMDPVDAMKLSAKRAFPSFWAIFGVIFVSSLAAALGLLGCCIGVFFTVPVIYLAQAAVYRQLFEDGGAEDTDPPPPLPHPPSFQP